jgi:MATE family, multidrug efflux pump
MSRDPPATVSEAPPPRGDFWSVARESLRGSSTRDYTSGPIGRAIVLLAVPMVLEIALESVFAVVDIFFVSRLGADAVATVGLTESMLAVVYAIAAGLGIGATAIVARRIGEKDDAGAARAATQAIILGVAISIPIAAAGVFGSRWLLREMGATAGVLQHASFTTIVLGGNAAIMLLFLINGAFRGAGDATVAMRVLWLANIINLCLDPCLIFGLGPFPRLGVAGAAVSTTTGRGIAVVVQLVLLMRGRARLRVKPSGIRLEPAVMANIVRVSGSAVVQMLVATTSWIGLIRILAVFGSDVLAGYTIAIRLILFALLPSWGMSNAAATLVGQNLGAGHPERAEASAWWTAFYNMWMLAAVSVVFMLFAEGLVSAFTSDAAVGSYAAQCLRIVSAGFIFYAYGMVLTQAFNGAGDTRTPTLLNFVCFWVWEVPLAFVLARMTGLGPRGVFWAIALAFSSLAVLSAAIFHRGRWKLKRV